jgi:phosphatidylserine synthase
MRPRRQTRCRDLAGESLIAAEETVRIPPEAALRPGTRDPAALLALWFLRKSVYWMVGVGLIVAGVVTRSSEITVGVNSTGEAWSGLFSPLAGVVLALLIRLGTSQTALVLAWGLARSHYSELEPRTGFGSGIGTFLDRLMVARAFRSLRWTHHVRQLAVRRLGRTGTRLARLDPVLDVANVALLTVAVVVLSLIGADSG